LEHTVGERAMRVEVVNPFRGKCENVVFIKAPQSGVCLWTKSDRKLSGNICWTYKVVSAKAWRQWTARPALSQTVGIEIAAVAALPGSSVKEPLLKRAV